MKRLALILGVGALMLSTPMLTACAAADALSTAVTAATQPASNISPTAAIVMNDAKKGLTAAHDAHAAAADMLTKLAQGATIHGQDAVNAKKWLDTSETALVVADKLVAVGDANGIMAKVSQANALIAQVQALFGK